MAKSRDVQNNEAVGEGTRQSKRDILARQAERHSMILILRAERVAQGVSLAEIERRVGIVKTMLSRLENDSTTNPTIDTVQRYASALGKSLTLSLVDAAPASARKSARKKAVVE